VDLCNPNGRTRQGARCVERELFCAASDEGLALRQHRHCVAGEQEDTLDTVKRGSKSGRPVRDPEKLRPSLVAETL